VLIALAFVRLISEVIVASLPIWAARASLPCGNLFGGLSECEALMGNELAGRHYTARPSINSRSEFRRKSAICAFVQELGIEVGTRPWDAPRPIPTANPSATNGRCHQFLHGVAYPINTQSVLPCGRRHSPHLSNSSQRKPIFRKATPHARSMVLVGQHHSILAALG